MGFQGVLFSWVVRRFEWYDDTMWGITDHAFAIIIV